MERVLSSTNFRFLSIAFGRKTDVFYRQYSKKRKVFRHLCRLLWDMHYGEDDIIELWTQNEQRKSKKGLTQIGGCGILQVQKGSRQQQARETVRLTPQRPDPPPTVILQDGTRTAHSECRNQVRRIVHWTTDKPLAVFIAAAVGEAQLSLAVVIVSSLTAYHAWFGKEESQMALVLKLI